MGGSNLSASEARWWEPFCRDDYKPEPELPAYLRELARSPYEHSPERRAAFLQAAEVIERLLLVTSDSPSAELAMVGYPGYGDDFAAKVLTRMRAFGISASEAISRALGEEVLA